jgi:hypothetical protein
MPAELQEPLDGLEACRVKFVDVALDEIDTPPEIDEQMDFAVTAVCVAHTRERMKDGEMRRTARMRVLTLAPTSAPAKPSAGPTLFSISDDEDDD